MIIDANRNIYILNIETDDTESILSISNYFSDKIFDFVLTSQYNFNYGIPDYSRMIYQ